jgi:hypothetical protein
LTDLSNDRPVNQGLEEPARVEFGNSHLRADQICLQCNAKGIEVALPKRSVLPRNANFGQKVFAI